MSVLWSGRVAMGDKGSCAIVGAKSRERVEAPPIASTVARCHGGRAASGAVLGGSASHQGFGWAFRCPLGVSSWACPRTHFSDGLTTGTSIRTSGSSKYHRGRGAPEGVGVSVSESMQDESALPSLDLAGLESLRSICSSTALTELFADFRVRRPASVSSAWRTRWCCG